MSPIPAAHLDALGFALGDPPVQTAADVPVGVWQWRAVLTSNPKTMLALEESTPTLLRALARQYGAKLEPGDVPRWWRSALGTWWLDWDVSQGSKVFAPPGEVVGDWMEGVPALTAGMTRLEALAAVIAWVVSQ